ncbi:DASH complex subunit Dad3 [Schizosaccharomyces cryophilus OY26]|uniref:DASH complex subunit DAD3 n=1 Tax=Schizosaccharomyces cryophilus (strain OY26 / ATCC MYA-4695 / CBS 11777 / NBRC 106824 / NRRL Y48691) TaxID=653667 RepID=S9WZP6_SCHCR|nr:DASH complex subunit Dad3 [Schizosaccharomyces cryophilus OY26]EPY50197.1 DASH complex subunit Dad3 [Schizosaccharomyces cryophilus OY26]
MSEDSTSLKEKQVLQKQVLDEYTKLAMNMDALAKLLHEMVYNPTNNILDSLRELEKEIGLVHTLFKASVWAILADLETQDTKT